MSQEKQIEEMACAMCGNNKICVGEGVKKCILYPTMWRYANNAYREGYHKQRGGEWKLGKSGCMYFCSECNYAAHPREVDEWSYCPRCGAKMKERIAHEQERNAPGE